MTTVLISAGDASGDLHGADFVRAFRAQYPDARILGLGGDEMREAGVELVVHQRDLAVGGLLELVRAGSKIAATWRRMGRALNGADPDLVVLVDSGGFNIPFARRVRRRGRAKILYFVAPQVWAWRPGRIRKLAARVDRMAVIFPFEPAAYRHTTLPVEFVGHPALDRLAEESEDEEWASKSARLRLGCPPEARMVSLFPGSRSNEIRNHLPLQLAASARLHAQFPDMCFRLALAPTVSRERVDRSIADARLPRGMNLEVVEGQTRDIMLATDVAIAKPGTVTLELALCARPMVVMGRVNPVTARLLRRAVRVPFYAMPNLVAGREIVPELLQEEARPEAIAKAVAQLTEGTARQRQLKELAEVRAAMSKPMSEPITKSGSKPGAARRASEIAGEMLESPVR